MGWLDKLMGRDKSEPGGSASASMSTEEAVSEPAGAEAHDSHEGHDHAPGEHPHEENQ